VKRLIEVCRKPLADIGLGDLQRFAHSLDGLAPVSRGRTLAAIRSLFGFGQRMRYLATNPAAELALPRYERRLAERILDERDVQSLLCAEGKQRDELLLRLVYLAGLRVSEVCQLRWRNLAARGNTGQITVFGKNGKTRAILLPADLWSDLMLLRGNADAPVFPSRTGRSLDRGRIRRMLQQLANHVGIAAPVSPHSLRHAHASQALDHGAPIRLVQATLGLSSVATTTNYLHARPVDSSSRFVSMHVSRSRVMNGVTAAGAAKGETSMNSEAVETNSKTK
jgi:integrase/recombinase XerD